MRTARDSNRLDLRPDAWRRREPSPFAGRPGRPLLIGGCPRSGTTLLRSLLNNHPELAVPAETDLVLPLWVRRGRCGDLRDPRAAAASQVRAPWFEGQPLSLASAAATWETAVARVDGYADRLRPDQLLDVRYEDLVLDPDGTLERVCAFAGLEGGDTVGELAAGPQLARFGYAPRGGRRARSGVRRQRRVRVVKWARYAAASACAAM